MRSSRLGYRHTLKLDHEAAQAAVDGLEEFGDWARRVFLEDVTTATSHRGTMFAGDDSPGIAVEELSKELVDEHPRGYDWTGISNVALLHSPDQVLYTSIDDPNDTRLVRNVLHDDQWPVPGYGPRRPKGDVFQIPMGLGSLDTPRPPVPVLFWEDIAWPQFVGRDAFSRLFKTMDCHGVLVVWASILEAGERARSGLDEKVSKLSGTTE